MAHGVRDVTSFICVLDRDSISVLVSEAAFLWQIVEGCDDGDMLWSVWQTLPSQFPASYWTAKVVNEISVARTMGPMHDSQ